MNNKSSTRGFRTTWWPLACSYTRSPIKLVLLGFGWLFWRKLLSRSIVISAKDELAKKKKKLSANKNIAHLFSQVVFAQ